MGGKQDDFIFRYQPGLGGEDIELIAYLKSFPPQGRKQMILMALRAFFEVEALKKAQSSPEFIKLMGEINLEILARRVEYLGHSLGLQIQFEQKKAFNASSSQEQGLISVKQPNIPTEPQPVYAYRSLGMNLR